MAVLRYTSAGGTIQRALHTDDADPFKVVQETSITYDDGFAQRNRELGEHQTGNMKLVARGVPATVYEQSVREGWDDKAWERWLNDPDNSVFRVWRGRV